MYGKPVNINRNMHKGLLAGKICINRKLKICISANYELYNILRKEKERIYLFPNKILLYVRF